MTRLSRLLTSTLSFLTLVNVLLAQTTPASPQRDYSQEPLIYVQFSTKVSLENTGLSKSEVTVRAKVNSEAGVQQLGVLRFSYESAAASMQINYVRVRKPDGTVVDTPADNIQDMPADITREAPFYSDIREKHIAIKGLSPGDVLEYSYTDTLEKPLIPGQFWLEYNFIRHNIALEEDLEVRFPRDRNVKYKSLVSQPTITEDSTTRVLRWTAANTKVEDPDSNHPRRTALEQIQGRQPQPDIRLSSFQNWDEIGRWYDSLQRDRLAVTPEIAAKAAALIKSVSDDDAKLRAIYNYVSLQFRYIGIAFGIGRYQPHSASEILGNQYGDCKDKHTLLAALLTAAGFQVHPALINSIRDLDPDVPSPSQFNHVISVVERNSNLTWLDTTTEVGPFGYLIPQLLDKKALVIAGSKPAQLLTTPAQLPFKSILQFKLDGKLDKDGTLEAKVERTDRGDAEVILRAALRRLSPAQWKELIQRVSYGSGFGGDVDNVVASSLDNIDEPLHISYNYTRQKFGDWENRRVPAPMPFLLYAKAPNEKPESVPFWLGNPAEDSLETRVELPSGYSFTAPEDVNTKYEFAEYHASYQVGQSVLIAKRQLSSYRTQVPIAELRDFDTFRKNVNDDYQKMVTLSFSDELAQAERGNQSLLQQALFTFPDSENAEASRLEGEGRHKMQKKDIAAGIEALVHSVEADPKFARGWIALGTAYLVQENNTEALKAFRSAIDADPKQSLSYKILAAKLAEMKQWEPAAETLQDLTKRMPDDSDAHEKLATIHYQLKRYKDAAAEYELAIQTGKDKPQLEADLGLSYLQAGDHEHGVAAVDKAVALDSTPLSLNNIAYELANAHLELSKSQEYAEKAVTAVEEESHGVTIENITSKDLRRMSALSSYWDTLGWVYFRSGNLEEAEKYLRAAWVLSEQSIIGDHLGQVYEKQGKKALAFHTYEMALSALPDDPRELAVMGDSPQRLRQIARNNAQEFHGKGASELKKLLTIALPQLAIATGSADFLLLLSEGPRIENVKFISGAESLRSAAQNLQNVKVNALFPDHGPTLLIRRGSLQCKKGAGCNLVLLTSSQARSVN